MRQDGAQLSESQLHLLSEAVSPDMVRGPEDVARFSHVLEGSNSLRRLSRPLDTETDSRQIDADSSGMESPACRLSRLLEAGGLSQLENHLEEMSRTLAAGGGLTPAQLRLLHDTALLDPGLDLDSLEDSVSSGSQAGLLKHI